MSTLVLVSDVESQYLRKYLSDALITPNEGVGMSVVTVIQMIASYAVTHPMEGMAYGVGVSFDPPSKVHSCFVVGFLVSTVIGARNLSSQWFSHGSSKTASLRIPRGLCWFDVPLSHDTTHRYLLISDGANSAVRGWSPETGKQCHAKVVVAADHQN